MTKILNAPLNALRSVLRKKAYMPSSTASIANKSYENGNGRTVFLSGVTLHFSKSGKLHRDDGFPAVTYADGKVEYWKNGKLHRDGGRPAIQTVNTNDEWWLKDNVDFMHKINVREWWVNNRRHRGGGLPAVVHMNWVYEHDNKRIQLESLNPATQGGDEPKTIQSGFCRKEWWKNGKLHRDGGEPAIVIYIEGKEHKEWWKNGKLHRDGGLPAIEREDGTEEYWVNGIQQAPQK
jgi:hypothetical protein